MFELKGIGIIGAGQLGMMLADAIHKEGYEVYTLDPAVDAPAAKVSDFHIVAEYDDPAALDKLCSMSSVVTYEFENIPAEAIMPFVEKYKNIKQGFKPLADSQNRVREKTNARNNGLPVASFWPVNSGEDLRNALKCSGYPAIFKSATLGYDGHGQVKLESENDIEKCLAILEKCKESHLAHSGDLAILEEFVPFDYEVSVILVGDPSRGDIISFPVGRNRHSGGILDLCVVPSGMNPSLESRMIESSKSFMRSCGYSGILTIEYFVKGDSFYFNEMAPRPHNSGHYTIEGCTSSQYTELAGFLVGRPLRAPELVAPTIMKNILGEDLEAAEKLLAEGPEEGVYVHLYGKTESRPKRKMGHITFVGMELQEYMDRYSQRFVKK